MHKIVVSAALIALSFSAMATTPFTVTNTTSLKPYNRPICSSVAGNSYRNCKPAHKQQSATTHH